MFHAKTKSLIHVLDVMGATGKKPNSYDNNVSSSQVEPGASGEGMDEDDDDVGVNVEKEAEIPIINREADAAE